MGKYIQQRGGRADASGVDLGWQTEIMIIQVNNMGATRKAAAQIYTANI